MNDSYLEDNCIESILRQRNVLANEPNVQLLNICCGVQDDYQHGSNILLIQFCLLLVVCQKA